MSQLLGQRYLEQDGDLFLHRKVDLTTTLEKAKQYRDVEEATKASVRSRNGATVLPVGVLSMDMIGAWLKEAGKDWSDEDLEEFILKKLKDPQYRDFVVSKDLLNVQYA